MNKCIVKDLNVITFTKIIQASWVNMSEREGHRFSVEGTLKHFVF